MNSYVHIAIQHFTCVASCIEMWLLAAYQLNVTWKLETDTFFSDVSILSWLSLHSHTAASLQYGKLQLYNIAMCNACMRLLNVIVYWCTCIGIPVPVVAIAVGIAHHHYGNDKL